MEVARLKAGEPDFCLSTACDAPEKAQPSRSIIRLDNAVRHPPLQHISFSAWTRAGAQTVNVIYDTLVSTLCQMNSHALKDLLKSRALALQWTS